MSSPHEVRYGTPLRWVEDQPWTPCLWARVTGEVLIICLEQNDTSERFNWVPLRGIRGPIQYRTVNQQTEMI